jgi:hypothetical protein
MSEAAQNSQRPKSGRSKFEGLIQSLTGPQERRMDFSSLAFKLHRFFPLV